jgi:hypothetical protein
MLETILKLKPHVVPEKPGEKGIDTTIGDDEERLDEYRKGGVGGKFNEGNARRNASQINEWSKSSALRSVIIAAQR